MKYTTVNLQLSESIPASVSDELLQQIHTQIAFIRRLQPDVPTRVPTCLVETARLNRFIQELNKLRALGFPGLHDQIADLLAWRPPQPHSQSPPSTTPIQSTEPIQSVDCSALSPCERAGVRLSPISPLAPETPLPAIQPTEPIDSTELIHPTDSCVPESEISNPESQIPHSPDISLPAIQTADSAVNSPQNPPPEATQSIQLPTLHLLTSDAEPTQMRRESDAIRRAASDDPAQTRRISDANRRKDPRSPLDQLSPEDEAFVLDAARSLGNREAARRLAEPPPVGLGLQTTEGSIRRLLNRVADFGNNNGLEVAEDLMDNALRHLPPNPTNAEIASALLELRLVSQIHTSWPNPDNLPRFALVLNRLRSGQSSRRKPAVAQNPGVC